MEYSNIARWVLDPTACISDASPTFALRRLLADRPNYIWFACNNNHPKKA
jgi:hypothetical protein